MFTSLNAYLNAYFKELGCPGDGSLQFRVLISINPSLKASAVYLLGSKLNIRVCASNSLSCSYLGNADLINSPGIYELRRDADNELVYALPIDPYHLELIEKLRGGGKLRMKLEADLMLVLRFPVDSISSNLLPSPLCVHSPPQWTCLVKNEVAVKERTTDATITEVPIEDWLRSYECLGGPSFVFLELSVAEEKGLEEVYKHINEAREQMLRDSRLAFNELRKALEALKVWIPDELKEKDAKSGDIIIDFKKVYDNSSSMGDIIDGLFRALWRLTSKFSHESPDYIPTRADMEMAIAMTMTLVNSIVTAIKRPKLSGQELL